MPSPLRRGPRRGPSGPPTDLGENSTVLLDASTLSLLAGSPDGQSLYVAGRTAAGDGGQGHFYWVPDSTATPDQAIVYGSTAFGRWLRSIGNAPIDPRWFGPVTAATINAALVAAQSQVVSTVLVPRGAYTVTGSGTDRILLLSNTRLEFEPGCTISTGALTATSIVIFADSTTRDIENASLEGNGLVLECSNAEAFTGYGIGVNVQNAGDICRNIRISNVEVRNARTDGVLLGGNAGPFMEGIVLTGVTCTGCGRNGMSIAGQVDGATFIDCHFDDNGTVSAPRCGVDVEVDAGLEQQNIRFVRCTFDRNLGMGLFNQGPTVGVTTHVQVEDCQANDNALSGFASRAVETAFFDCGARGNLQEGFDLGADVSAVLCSARDNGQNGFRLVDQNSKIAVSDCTSQFNGFSGFTHTSDGGSTGVTVATNCHAYGNILRGFALSGSHNCSLDSCRATANRQDGIQLFNSWHCSVSDCWIGNNGQDGDNTIDNLIVEAGSSLNRITNNTIRQSTNFAHATAVSGSPTTVVLGSPSSDTDDVYEGMLARIISGTGAGGSGTITDYDGATRTATLTWTPAVAPDATSVIEIVGNRLYLGPVASSTATLVTLPTELSSSINDVFDGSFLIIVSGPGAGQISVIDDYAGATHTATVATALAPVPTFESTIAIFACRRPRFGGRIAAGCVGNCLWGNDAYFAGASNAISDAGTGTVTVATNRTT